MGAANCFRNLARQLRDNNQAADHFEITDVHFDNVFLFGRNRISHNNLLINTLYTSRIFGMTLFQNPDKTNIQLISKTMKPRSRYRVKPFSFLLLILSIISITAFVCRVYFR